MLCRLNKAMACLAAAMLEISTWFCGSRQPWGQGSHSGLVNDAVAALRFATCVVLQLFASTLLGALFRAAVARQECVSAGQWIVHRASGSMMLVC